MQQPEPKTMGLDHLLVHELNCPEISDDGHTVSQQLARLRLDGLVTTRRDGKVIYYSLADTNTLKFVKVIYEMFCSGTGSAKRSS